MSTITTINPTTGASLTTYPATRAADVQRLINRAHLAAKDWGRSPLPERIQALRELAAAMKSESAFLAHTMTSEMGKPRREAIAEIEKCIATANYYVEHAERHLAAERVDIEGVEAWVSYEPMGLVLAVMPWNFPLWQVMRFALPAVASGNAVLLKHSPNVTGLAIAVQEIFVTAGFPCGIVTSLHIAESEVDRTVDALIQDSRIAAVTLTGSNRAGSAVGASAGRAAKKSVMELGGSDALVVLADADLVAAAAAAVRARFQNAGQSCIAAKRIIVEAAVADEFTELFVGGVEKLVVGDPSDPATDMGPMARADLREELKRQVSISIVQGATLLTGGNSIAGAGFFYQPTVLGNALPGMAVFDEETFGPVAALVVARDACEAMRLADATEYGLSLSIWTKDVRRAVNLAKTVTSGSVFVNAISASDARLPFGGTKKSGHGRELGQAGIREFCNARTYWVKPQGV